MQIVAQGLPGCFGEVGERDDARRDVERKGGMEGGKRGEGMRVDRGEELDWGGDGSAGL